MKRDSSFNGLAETARLTVTVPLSVYLEMVRRSKGKLSKSAYVEAALRHYSICHYTGLSLIESAIAHAESNYPDTDSQEG